MSERLQDSFDRDPVKDRHISPYHLEKAAEDQPNMYGFWASELADAKSERDRLKIRCKKVEGKIGVDLRSGKTAGPIDAAGKPVKLTEGFIAALIDSNTKVVIAREDLREAEYKVNFLQGQEESMQHRRSSINGLITLFEKEYYSQAGRGKDPRETTTDKGSSNVRKNLKKKEL